MSSKSKFNKIKERIEALEELSAEPRLIFVNWYDWYCMTQEERDKTRQAPQNIVIESFPTKAEREEYGDILEAERLAYLEEKKNKRGW